MKALLVFVGLMAALPALAGGMRQIPLRLVEVDNAGRVQFLKNAVAAVGLAGDNTVRYSGFSSIILTGDEDDANTSGGVFHYKVEIDSSANDTYRRFECSQQLTVGEFERDFTRPIDCRAL